MPLSKIDSDSLNSGAVTSTALASGVPTRAQLPAGSVLQVVQGTTQTYFYLNTTTLTDIVSATITPTSATSKILVFVTVAAVGKFSTNSEGFFALYKNGSALISPFDGIATYTAGAATVAIGSVSCDYLDSPASTSALTYVIKASDDQSAGLRINWEGGLTSITLMEIAA